jgi:hypothetical protein
VVGSVVVNGGQGVVKQHKVTVEIGAAGKVEALALATGQVDATQAGLGLVTLGQDLQVELQGAVVDNLDAKTAAQQAPVSTANPEITGSAAPNLGRSSCRCCHAAASPAATSQNQLQQQL